MASIFPSTPSLNDIFTSNGTTWQWNGEAWVVVADEGQTFNTVVTSPSSQTITADSGTDTLTIAAGTNISVSANSSNDTLTISSTIDTQNLINTASAAAYASASGYTNFIVDGLDTLDIEENTNLYFTEQRAIDATSSLITSASAYSLSESNTYSNSASANALTEANAYTDSASASLVAYTDQEVSALQLFSNISTSPSTQLITGDSNSDTLTFISGENITISADSSTDSITINSTGNYTSVDSISYPDYIVFDTTPENTSASVSTLAWDSGESSLSVQLNANLNVGIGQEIIILANNGEATQLNKGEVVRLSGASGQRPQVIRAYNLNDTGSALTIGLVAENISAGGEGFIVTQGIVKNINTDGFNEGDILYLSASAGVLTTVKPQAPNHYVFVGVVVKKNASSGRIYVKPQNGYELDELHDVRITSVANGDIIIWNSASTLWMNEPIQNYLNTASAAAYASASAYTDSQINALTTSDIEEGTNLYFTNERAVNAGSATYILQTSEQGIINSASAAAVTYLVDSAPGALDTLNELAAALGDDENFATTVINTIASASANAITSANSYTDTEVAEAIVTASAAAVAYADGLTTTDIAEGTNLYYTTARGQETASTMFVHGNHTNVSAQYVSGEIRLTSSAAGGGGATVAYQTTQPDVTSLDAGSLWIDSDQDTVSGLLPATFTRWVKVLSASATTISGLDDNALSLLYTPGYEKVFINGTLLVRGSDYTASTGNTVVLTVAAETTDVIEIHSYEAFQIADTYTQAAADAKFFPINESRVDRWTKTYSASATTITGTDDYAESLLYTSGLESLFINGVLVDPSEYTRTSASVITPDEAILSGDVVDIISPKAFDVANTYTIAQIDNKYNNRTRWTKTFSASATVISGVDDNANTLSYTSGYEEVYLNGILLTPITDYARTSASVITLGAAVVTNDIIDVVNIQPFNVADVYTEAESDAKYLTKVSASSTYAPVAAGGLVLINKTTFSGTTSVSINNAFNASYDNYKIIISNLVGDGGTIRLRASGSDDSTSNYMSRAVLIANAAFQANRENSTSSWTISSMSSYGTLTFDLTSPYLTSATNILLSQISAGSSSSGAHLSLGGVHTASTSFDGFTLTGSINISGTVRIYGYRSDV